jgi:serine/threonine-protein kinase RsbT
VSSAIHVPIRHESDVAVARASARAIGAREGLSVVAREALATAVSEIACNILDHALVGELVLAPADEGRRGVVVVARDQGSGIADLELAMEDGYTTGEGLGMGLPAARELVDEFELASTVGHGTTVTMRMYARREQR